uniref:NME/NM23 family member 5 n=1 Tax=Equus asinus TaxID=9793 RepID=A0A9L0IP99_EQUAS
MEISMPPPQIYVEKTLAIIKPDIVDKEEEIQDIILRSGFTIVQIWLADWLLKNNPNKPKLCHHPVAEERFKSKVL